MRTPVAFIIFNRPDVSARVFAEIARARPRTLLVIADGPRPDHPLDVERCAAARAVIDRVDWDCEVLKNYSDENLGCGRRPATGLSWVFDQVEEAIVLEDDCFPHPTFFRFCEEMLEKYRDDERVMHVSGDDFLTRKRGERFSYFFSCYCLSWGWATWRRAFQHYDRQIQLWPTLRDTSWLSETLGDPEAVLHWQRIFDRVYKEGEASDVWDFQWLFTIWARHGLAILPNANLVSNIGFGEDATHTKGVKNNLSHLPLREMMFPLQHPLRVARDHKTEQAIFKQLIGASRPALYRQLCGRIAAALFSTLRSRVRDGSLLSTALRRARLISGTGYQER